jgi:hydrogenase maturation protease
VLALAVSMGPISAQIFLLGCEPNDFGDVLEGRMGLSPPVQAAVKEASNIIEDLVGRILATERMFPSQLQIAER